jgi:hypothetical protein
LNLTDGKQLTWTRCRSRQFEFERLVRPPRLHAADEASSAGRLLESVHLSIVPSAAIPTVPDLLPVVPTAR